MSEIDYNAVKGVRVILDATEESVVLDELYVAYNAGMRAGRRATTRYAEAALSTASCQHNRASDGTPAGLVCDKPAVLCEEHGGHDGCAADKVEPARPSPPQRPLDRLLDELYENRERADAVRASSARGGERVTLREKVEAMLLPEVGVDTRTIHSNGTVRRVLALIDAEAHPPPTADAQPFVLIERLRGSVADALCDARLALAREVIDTADAHGAEAAVAWLREEVSK